MEHHHHHREFCFVGTDIRGEMEDGYVVDVFSLDYQSSAACCGYSKWQQQQKTPRARSVPLLLTHPYCVLTHLQQHSRGDRTTTVLALGTRSSISGAAQLCVHAAACMYIHRCMSIVHHLIESSVLRDIKNR